MAESLNNEKKKHQNTVDLDKVSSGVYGPSFKEQYGKKYLPSNL